MDFVDEINEAISKELEEFKAFIEAKILNNKDYLQQYFWLRNGSQTTVLNYLIQVHQEKNKNPIVNESDNDLTALISYIFELLEDKNIGEPLHLVIKLKKIELFYHLTGIEQISEINTSNIFHTLDQAGGKTKSNHFDFNKRDSEGRTLISLALNTQNKNLLINILANKPNIHAITKITRAKVMFQPIHQAIVLDFADGVRLLAHAGAQLDNSFGTFNDTPLLLAARLGKINALEALLEFPHKDLKMEAENNNLYADQKNGHTAIEELCELFAADNENHEAIRGIAMMLCRGAEPPRKEEMRQLLRSNRIVLLKIVHSYLEHQPELVDSFVNRCHLRESALHNIVYSDHSWGSSIRRLFGIPSEAAFIIENLVTRKYDNPQANLPNTIPLSSTRAEHLLKETNPVKLYAEFVRRYTQAYDSQLITNRWSTMRWMIAEGNCDWATVVDYARNHPTSRTRIIYNEMFHPVPQVHEDLEKTVNDISLKPIS